MAARVLGVDSGGTFTDFVLWEEGRVRIHKRASTPDDPSRAILDGLREGGFTVEEVVHGTTVATNTILTGTGARTAFVTTKGFRDILTIGRQARSRADLYSLSPAPVPTLVPRDLCFEADERVSAEGEVLRELTDDEARRVMTDVAASGVECVAVCLLFSFLVPEHERLLKRTGEELGLRVSASHAVLPEAREYERASTTVVNSYVAPKMARYLEHLGTALADVAPGRLRIMLSDGTAAPVAAAAEKAVRTVLSGPAAGVAAAFSLGSAHGHDRVLTLDMGGTSTDVSFCAGEVALRRDVLVGGLPIATPAVDVHSVGAGGGSIAYIDEAGALRVGPESAGAEPGPAGYGHGGPATVTDAQVVLQRIAPDRFLGGRMALDAGAAHRAVAALALRLGSDVEGTAAAIVAVANAEMERALRRVTVERGYDPRDATMVAFGGAGPLHACELAVPFGISRVLVPPYPGLLSALGLVIADEAADVVLPVYREATAEVEATMKGRIDDASDALTAHVAGESGRDITSQLFVSMRYPGQSHELLLSATEFDAADLSARFHETHQRRFGHSDADSAVEITTVRLRVSVPSGREVRAAEAPSTSANGDAANVWSGGGWADGRAYAREQLAAGARLAGPAIVHQMDATTLVPVGWRAWVAGDTTLVLERGALTPGPSPSQGRGEDDG